MTTYRMKEYKVDLVVKYSPCFFRPSMVRLEKRLNEEIPSWDIDVVSMKVRGMRDEKL